MPKGTTHAKATLALAAASGYLAFRGGYPLPQVMALTGGTLAGLILTPDLDLDEGCISHDIVRRTAGRRIGRLWALLWRPYGLLLPHRSRLSHMPVLGTAVRLAYISILPALLWFFAGLFAVDLLNSPVFPAWGLWAICGLVLADTLHYLMDSIF